MSKESLTQESLIMEYFIKHPKIDIKHPDVVDWAVREYKEKTGGVLRDPDRAIRKLAQEGKLIKVGKGVYKYDPDFLTNRHLEDFTQEQKETIFKRDGYKCVMCGKGIKDGVDIHADHIKPKDLGGKATIENGQTLCGPHNYLKKNFKQTETGKKMFIRLYELAKSMNDKKLEAFCGDILSVFEKHNMNGHIEWKK